MAGNNILSLLGLALRGGNLVAGEEPVEAAARARSVRILLLAQDAADNTRRRVQHFSQLGQCLWLSLPFTKAELGRAVGRAGVAVAAITDTGLAHAVVQRLADQDPDTYGDISLKLALKVRRAAERKAHPRQKDSQKDPGTARRRVSPPAGRSPAASQSRQTARAGTSASRGSPRPADKNRPKPRAKATPYAHSLPVKKGKGSFRKKEG